MTNHITDLQEQLAELQGAQPSHRTPSDMQLLQIAATLAVAQELRGIGNMMAWGAPDDIPPRVPASASPDYTIEIDEALSEVATPVELYECTQAIGAENCDGCHAAESCGLYTAAVAP